MCEISSITEYDQYDQYVQAQLIGFPDNFNNLRFVAHCMGICIHCVLTDSHIYLLAAL